MTVITVANDQKRKPTPEETIMFCDRAWDLQRRFREGKLDPARLVSSIQQLSEGNVIADGPLPQMDSDKGFKKMGRSVNVASMPEMEVEHCFDGGLIGPLLDRKKLFSGQVPAMKGGIVEVFEITRSIPPYMTYREIAQNVLGIKSSDNELKTLLRSRGHTFHLKQVDNLLSRTLGNEITGIHNRTFSLFFVEDGKGEVFGLNAEWITDRGLLPNGWYVGIHAFEEPAGWNFGNRFFTRNKA